MDPARFLVLARLLKGGTCDPEYCRTSISRAYYAAYNVGVSAFDAIGIGLPKTADAHGLMAECLNKSADRQFLKARSRLTDLRAMRNAADYDMEDPDSERRERAEYAFREAELLIGDFDTLKNKTCNPNAINNIRQFAISKKLRVV